jgi:hypothetical protein
MVKAQGDSLLAAIPNTDYLPASGGSVIDSLIAPIRNFDNANWTNSKRLVTEAAIKDVRQALLDSIANGGSGVADVSVVTANGFGGSVANPTTSPDITITTSVNGLLKGNGTGVSAATSSDYVSPNGVETITNKNITKRVYSTASTSSLTMAAATYDQVNLTLLAENITINAPSGVKTNGQKLILRIFDGTVGGHVITWDALFKGSLPARSMYNSTMYLEMVWNSDIGVGQWDVLDMSIYGDEQVFITTGYITTGANTTPVNVTGIAFYMEPSAVYSFSWSALVIPGAATTGCGFQINDGGIGSAISMAFTHQLATTGTLTGGSSVSNDASATVSSGFPSTAGWPVIGSGHIINSTSGGIAQLRLRSETTSTVGIQEGMVFKVKRIR